MYFCETIIWEYSHDNFCLKSVKKLQNIQPEAEKQPTLLFTKSVFGHFVARAVLAGNELDFCGAVPLNIS